MGPVCADAQAASIPRADLPACRPRAAAKSRSDGAARMRRPDRRASTKTIVMPPSDARTDRRHEATHFVMLRDPRVHRRRRPGQMRLPVRPASEPWHGHTGCGRYCPCRRTPISLRPPIRYRAIYRTHRVHIGCELWRAREARVCLRTTQNLTCRRSQFRYPATRIAGCPVLSQFW